MVYVFLTLSLLMLYTIYRIGKDIYRSYQCVDERTLRNFLYGRLERGSERYRHVTSHLAQCEKCQDALRNLQRGKPLEDHLVED